MDTLLAGALEVHEGSLCPSCGQPRDETFDPLNDGDNSNRTAQYVVSEPLRDHACSELSRARKEIEDAEMPYSEALRFGLSKVPIVRPQA